MLRFEFPDGKQLDPVTQCEACVCSSFLQLLQSGPLLLDAPAEIIEIRRGIQVRLLQVFQCLPGFGGQGIQFRKLLPGQLQARLEVDIQLPDEDALQAPLLVTQRVRLF